MLEQLRDEYAILHNYVKQVKTNLRRLENQLPALKNASKNAAKAHVEAQAARDLEDTFGQLVRRRIRMSSADPVQRREMIWAHVVKAETERDAADKALETATAKLDNAVTNMGKIEQWLALGQTRLEEAEAKKAAFDQGGDDSTAERATIRAETEAIRTAMNAIKADQRRMNNDIQEQRALIEANQTSLQQAQQALAARDDGASDRLRDQIRDADARREAMKAELETQSALALATKPLVDEAKDAHKEADDAVNAARHHWEDANGRLRTAQQTSDPIAVYGPNTARAIADVRRRQWRSHCPIGPLGAHVKLDPNFKQWATVVETVLNENMASWVCFDYQDEKDLRRLLASYNMCVDRTWLRADVAGARRRSACPAASSPSRRASRRTATPGSRTSSSSTARS